MVRSGCSVPIETLERFRLVRDGRGLLAFHLGATVQER